MRWLAALAFLLAAFDVPAWAVDRAGLAAIGLACLALALGSLRPRRARAPEPEPELDLAALAAAANVQADELAAATRERLATWGSEPSPTQSP